GARHRREVHLHGQQAGHVLVLLFDSSEDDGESDCAVGGQMNPFDPKAALLAKHAQHVVLVHFPIALFMTGVLFDLAARWTKEVTRQTTLAAGSRLNI